MDHSILYFAQQGTNDARVTRRATGKVVQNGKDHGGMDFDLGQRRVSEGNCILLNKVPFTVNTIRQDTKHFTEITYKLAHFLFLDKERIDWR